MSGDHQKKAQEARFEKLRVDMSEMLKQRHGIEAPELKVFLNDSDSDYVCIMWRQYGLEINLNLLVDVKRSFPGGMPINPKQLAYYSDRLVSDMVALKKDLGVEELEDELENEES